MRPPLRAAHALPLRGASICAATCIASCQLSYSYRIFRHDDRASTAFYADHERVLGHNATEHQGESTTVGEFRRLTRAMMTVKAAAPSAKRRQMFMRSVVAGLHSTGSSSKSSRSAGACPTFVAVAHSLLIWCGMATFGCLLSCTATM
jgi:hypothetical protein